MRTRNYVWIDDLSFEAKAAATTAVAPKSYENSEAAKTPAFPAF
jgi:hypothetical protein